MSRAARLSFGLLSKRAGSGQLYELKISPTGIGHAIDTQTLKQVPSAAGVSSPKVASAKQIVHYLNVKNAGWQPSLSEDPSRLPARKKMSPKPEQFRERLASSIHYHALDVGPRSPVRLPQPMRPAKLPGPDGEDLVTCLYDMKETEPNRYEAVEDALRAGFRDFDHLTFPPVAAGTLALIWHDRNFPRGFYMNQLSEGALRFLWLVTLLQSSALPTVTLLDEPEVSLHPELLNLLAHLLREASQRSQIVVATHSDRLVRFLKPNEVLVADLGEDGLTKLTWADSLDLEKWLDEYTLDEGYRAARGRA